MNRILWTPIILFMTASDANILKAGDSMGSFDVYTLWPFGRNGFGRLFMLAVQTRQGCGQSTRRIE
jgi:hypothetical protein